ncbi:2-phosphosulfolactate phosphatase [Streptomyces halstedii]|uniref:2-phosphosulfolactate phosphatase n=1 Tax=Streptomyces halstedii TaxID=1944 RepID=UPI003460B895
MRYQFVGTSELTQTPAVAVVIDVMRAFTVAAWVFARGAEKIVLASSEDEALALKRRHSEWIAVKDGAPSDGFDEVNSPARIAASDLTGRTVVQKTKAGTVGALAVADAPLALCASFLVADATARFVRAHQAEQVTFVVTGDDGRADEDLACAEYIGHCIGSDSVDVAPYLQRARYSDAAADLTEGLHRGYKGIHVDDVDYCLEVDRFPFAMLVSREGPLTVLRPVAVAVE